MSSTDAYVTAVLNLNNLTMHATMYNSAYQHAACPNVKDFVLLMKMYVSKWDISVVNKKDFRILTFFFMRNG